MTKSDLNIVFEHVGMSIKLACEDALDGVKLPKGNWAELGHRVDDTLEGLKKTMERELQKTAVEASRSVRAASLKKAQRAAAGSL
jgi:hypothetical protein